MFMLWSMYSVSQQFFFSKLGNRTCMMSMRSETRRDTDQANLLRSVTGLTGPLVCAAEFKRGESDSGASLILQRPPHALDTCCTHTTTLDSTFHSFIWSSKPFFLAWIKHSILFYYVLFCSFGNKKQLCFGEKKDKISLSASVLRGLEVVDNENFCERNLARRLLVNCCGYQIKSPGSS